MFHLQPNLALTRAQGAFIAPPPIIGQLFTSTLNTGGLTPPAAERWKHFRLSYCSQALSVWELKCDTTLRDFWHSADRCTVTPQVFEIRNVMT